MNSDPLPSRYLPFSILREGDFDLDEFSFLYDEAANRAYPSANGVPYFLQREHGRVLSRFSPLPALLAVPVYAIPVWSGLDPRSDTVRRLEKVAAAAIVSASVAVLYLVLASLVSAVWAAAIALVYALGTPSFSMSSQALWEHGAGQLFVASTLLLLVRAKADERLADLAGLSLALAVVTRIANASFALPIAMYVAHVHPWRLPRFGAWALVPLAAQLAYQHVYFGSIFRHGHEGFLTAWTWRTPLAEGLAGLLVSPGRGLFVFSPVLVLVLPGMVLAWRRGGPTLLRYLTIGAALFTVLYAKFVYWWAGWVYGPRYFADVLPILCVLLCPVVWALGTRRAFRAAFAVLSVASVAIHALGAFLWDTRWDAEARLEQKLDAIWSWRNGQIAYYAALVPAAVRRQGAALRLRTGALPTSAEAPSLLAAAYENRTLPRLEAVAGTTLDLRLAAVNTGGAVWLARTPEYRGAVRLGWRWLENGEQVPTPLERVDLAHPVFPGERYEFAVSPAVPSRPGEYDLEVGLVAELITWFSGTGTGAPLRFRVRVLPGVLTPPDGAPGGRHPG
jgi:hypothetical protein